MADQTAVEKALGQALADSQGIREELVKRVEHNGNIARQAQQENEKLKARVAELEAELKTANEILAEVAAAGEDDAKMGRAIEKIANRKKPAGAQVVEIRPPHAPPAAPPVP